MTDQNKYIHDTISYVKNQLSDAEAGHDWWHIQRVWKLSQKIAQTYEVDLTVVELGALLHDIADSKFHQGDETIGPEMAESFLISQNVPQNTIDHVVNIIKYISYKGGNQSSDFQSMELSIVQDADRLDALGAIGIARTFHYGGYRNNEIYNPAISPRTKMTVDQYRNEKSTTINHFYEKLLLLKDKMNTEVGKKMAQERHDFMKVYLDQFLEEWNV